MPLQTPFYRKYLEHEGNQIIEMHDTSIQWAFGPVDEEIKMVRERAGFCDYSTNNLLAVVGKDALAFLQKLIVNNVGKIGPGQSIYSSMLDDTGKILDDVIVSWIEEDHFFFNSGPLDRVSVTQWMTENKKGFDVKLIDLGSTFLALQGPKSREMLQKEVDVSDIPYFGLKQIQIRHIPVLIARLGFTGEIGYELYSHPLYANDLWDILLEIGKDYEAGPYGYGATLFLALEKGYLWGADFYEGSSPLEVGLGWTVAFDKADFIGREALFKRKEEGLKTKLVAFEVSDPAVMAMETDKLFKGDRQVGAVTNAGPGLSVNKPSIGRAWVNVESANEGEELDLEQGDSRTKIIVSLQKDWYDPKNIKVKS